MNTTLLRMCALLILTLSALMAGGPDVEIEHAEIHTITVNGSRVVVTFTGTVVLHVKASIEGNEGATLRVPAIRATLTVEHAGLEYLASETGRRTYEARLQALAGQRVDNMQGWFARTTIADANVTEVRFGMCPFLAPTNDERMFVLKPAQPKPEQP